MRQSRMAYFADFFVYPILLGVITLFIADDASVHRGLTALALALFGALLWTFLEYAMHRFVLHGNTAIAALHDAHHVHPRAWIGTPTWISLTAIAGLTLPVMLLGAPLFAYLSLAAGLMAGFLVYGAIHHVIHHRKPRILARALSTAARRHFQHHGKAGVGNFGVTTELWDRVFGTSLSRRSPASPHVRPARDSLP